MNVLNAFGVCIVIFFLFVLLYDFQFVLIIVISCVSYLYIVNWCSRRYFPGRYSSLIKLHLSSTILLTTLLLQVEIWKRYIRWEKDNPLRTDDQTLVTKRVRFAYEQCLLCLSHHPDIWYEAALFLQESSKLLSEKGVSCNATLLLNSKEEKNKLLVDNVWSVFMMSCSLRFW